MDRTIIAPYRAEEKELSQILYQKLQGLALLHPMPEELKKLLSDEMFVKPNQQAFFHVMHYLFRLIDQSEFKKRFYWPITDKKSEANFRTSTVEYLKYLNEKYHLNWTNIKFYLVVMPGGMKFISFMLDFVHFIIKELVKQKEKLLNIDSLQQCGISSEANLQKMCKKDSLFKEMAADFIESIEVINKSRQVKMGTMIQHLEELAATTKLSLDLLTDEALLSEFEGSNSVLFEQKFDRTTENVITMERVMLELKESMEKFYLIETGFKCDKHKLRQEMRRMCEELSVENVDEAPQRFDDSLTVNILIIILNGIIETIESELDGVDKRPRTGIVCTRLVDIQKDLRNVEFKITEFLMAIQYKVKRRQDLTGEPRTPVRQNTLIASAVNRPCQKNTLENTLVMKYVATPPIKLEMSGGHHGPSRLPLCDAKIISNATSTFGTFLAPQRNIRQTKLNSSVVENAAVDLNNTMNRSRLMNPIQLLRSINKDKSKTVSTPKTDISSLGSKWKERQPLITDKENEVPFTLTLIATEPNASPCTRKISNSVMKVGTPLSGARSSNKDAELSSTSTLAKKSCVASGSFTILQSPMTPFSTNDRTRIARSQLQFLETSSLSNQAASNSWTCTKKPSAVQKVQDASLYIGNLSTSPSGRLEALVSAEDFNLPKIKLNDLSLIDCNTSIYNSFAISNDCMIPIAETKDNNNTFMGSENLNDFVNSETQDEEAIFNISGSILNDVTM